MPCLELQVSGRVQGVGFRPFIAQLAHQHGITGWVRNEGSIVRIQAEGPDSVLFQFKNDVVQRAPQAARPQLHDSIELHDQNFTEFKIVESELGEEGATTANLPLDLFTCPECLGEMNDPNNRRYGYAFINCTQCGPRYTLIEDLPYDRNKTSMAAFELCPQCAAEYKDPLNRRYHAEPTACPICGPTLSWINASGQVSENALADAVNALSQGLIIAVKGVGGFHLMCDATRDDSVLKMRMIKARPEKPLAVLFSLNKQSPAYFSKHIKITERAENILTSVERPIVLCPRLKSSRVSKAIAPNLNNIGSMLPYTPLHELLIAAINKPLVVTSANLKGEPVCSKDNELKGLPIDGRLTHNREILYAADDSVFLARGLPVRLGRGHAPKTIELPFTLPHDVVALGAEDKITFALGHGNALVLSPHLGSLSSPRGQKYAAKTLGHMQAIYSVNSAVFIGDRHPQYSQRTFMAKRNDHFAYEVQHHEAHASAIWLDAWLQGRIKRDESIGVFVWDGTGFGDGGQSWGGEVFVGRPGHWQRRGSLKTFQLPGGDRCIYEPWRIARAMLPGHDFHSVSNAERELVTTMLERDWNCTTTTSVGRLLDACGALLGIEQVSFDAFSAMQLNDLAGGVNAEPLSLRWVEGEAGVKFLDWQPLLREMTRDEHSIQQRAACIFSTLVNAISNFIEQELPPEVQVGFSGGVFQSDRMDELLQRSKHHERFIYHQHFPSNDANIAIGQIIEYAGAKT